MGIKMQKKKMNAALAKATALLQNAKEADAAGNTALATSYREQAITSVEAWTHRNTRAQDLLAEATTTPTATTDVAPIEITVEVVETPTVEVAAAAAPTVEDVKTPAAAVAKKATAAATATKTTTKRTTWKKKK